MMRSLQTYIARLSPWIATLPEGGAQNYALFLVMMQHDPSRGPQGKESQADLPPDAFFELISAIGWVRPAGRSGELIVDGPRFSAEALTSR
jgi:hypothetical protein